jgi:hypothetical protein
MTATGKPILSPGKQSPEELDSIAGTSFKARRKLIALLISGNLATYEMPNRKMICLSAARMFWNFR